MSDFAKLEGKNKVTRRGIKLDKILTVFAFLYLGIIVFLPIAMIIYTTFFDHGRFDTTLFKEIVLNVDNIEAMKNTLIIAVGATIGGTLLGLFFAWLLGRSDIPLKGVMRSMFNIPYMFPPFFGAMAWELILSPRTGYFNKFLMRVFGLTSAPININSLGGIIFVEICYYFPFVFMQVVNALERMDPTLEESARIAGAGQWYVIRKITMPLVKPSIAAGALLIITTSLANFGIPAMLGFKQNIFTLPTKIYQLFYRNAGNYQGIREGSSLSILLVITVVFALLVQKLVLRSGSYDIIKGKSTRPMEIKLRGAKIPLLVLSFVVLAVIVVTPLVVVALVGFLKAYGLPMTLQNFTLDNYKAIFVDNLLVRDSVKNSLFLAVTSGIVVMFVGVLIAYVVVKVKPRGKWFLELLTMLPYAIPGIVMAIGVILTWSGNFGVNLYNTIWIILVAYMARYLSFSMKSASAALLQVHPSLEEAARSSGASGYESLLDVTIPLIKPAMVAGFFLIFLPAIRELTTSILLYGPYTRTLGVAIYSLRSDGYIVNAAALATVAIIFIYVLNTIVNAIVKDRKKG